MSELSKQALKVDNNQSFPNNNAGLITPSALRTFNENMIDSLVDELSYNVDSGSWNQQINALEQFTASVSGLNTGSLLVTASAVSNVMTFTKGDNSTFNVTVGSVIPSGTISGSQQISGLGFVSSSVTGSSLVTASFAAQTLTFTKGDGSQFGVFIPDNSGSLLPSGVVSGSAQISELGFQTTASFNTYTSSNDSKVNSLINATSSYAISSSVAAVDAGQQLQINSLIAATSSYATSAITASSLITASFSGNTLTFTKGDATTFGVVIPDVSGSTIPSGTVSGSSQIIELGFQTTSSFNAYTASQSTGSLLLTASFSGNTLTFTKADTTTFGVVIPDVSGSTINTGSFAITGSNTFIGNQTITGSILQSGSLLNELTKVQIAKSNKADFSEANTLLSLVGDAEVIFDIYADGGNYDTVNVRVIQNSGSQFRDYDGTVAWVPWLTIPTNTGNNPSPIFTRGLKITGSLGISGNITASIAQGFALVGGVGNISTLVATSSFGGALPSGVVSGSGQITALGFVSSSITGSSLITASVNLNTITFTKGDASTFALTIVTGSGGGAAFPFTGDAQISGSLGITGSMSGFVNTLSVASSTASVNFNNGNMFTITLPTGSVTHITPTNIRRGQTCNIQISQAASASTGSVTFSPNVLFAGGNDYQVTATGSAIDLLTFVSLDGTNVLGTSIKNFL